MACEHVGVGTVDAARLQPQQICFVKGDHYTSALTITVTCVPVIHETKYSGTINAAEHCTLYLWKIMYYTQFL